MKANEILLVEQHLLQEGMLGNLKDMATNIYSKFKDVLPQAKKIKPVVAANKDDIMRMFAEFDKLKSEGKLTPETVMQGFSKLADTVAQELPKGTAPNPQLSEELGVRHLLGGVYAYLAFQFADMMLKMGHAQETLSLIHI